MRVLLATLLLTAAAFSARAQYDPPFLTEWKEDSPDKKLFAVVRVFPDEKLFWKKDLDSAHLLVADNAPDSRGDPGPGWQRYVSFDLGHIVARIAWSPDSRFLVLTTSSAGGHSPWHYKTYVYVAADRTLRYVDDGIGLVLSPDFKFVGPHQIKLAVVRTGHTPVDDMDAPDWRAFDLEKIAPSLPKESPFRRGRLWDND